MAGVMEAMATWRRRQWWCQRRCAVPVSVFMSVFRCRECRRWVLAAAVLTRLWRWCWLVVAAAMSMVAPAAAVVAAAVTVSVWFTVLLPVSALGLGLRGGGGGGCGSRL